MSGNLISVAVAIIHQSDRFRKFHRFLMQLRDDIPTIAYPGVWGFFGGHVEPGETPAAALKRELAEEINFSAVELTEFSQQHTETHVRYVYSCPLTVPLEQLELNEGWDLKLLTIEEIRRGAAYSARAIAEKPLADVYRQILLDYLASTIK